MSMVCTVIRLPEEEASEMLANPEDVSGLIAGGSHPEIDLDKAWDAIRYLLRRLCPDKPLAAFPLGGGLPVGDDLGYGPGQAYLSSDVVTLAELLAATSPEDLRRAFDPTDMMKSVYPGVWDRDPSVDDTLGYVVEQFEKLKAFVAEAALKGEAIVAWIS